MNPFSRDDAEAFLIHEARLLDERRFDEWDRLFAASGVYWIPIDDKSEPGVATSLVFDEPLRRAERIHRLTQTPVQAQTPPSRTLHFIANVELAHRSEDSVTILSNQVVHELRRAGYEQAAAHGPRAIAARCEHRLSYVGDAWRITMKKVVLLERDLPIVNFTFIF